MGNFKKYYSGIINENFKALSKQDVVDIVKKLRKDQIQSKEKIYGKDIQFLHVHYTDIIKNPVSGKIVPKYPNPRILNKYEMNYNLSKINSELDSIESDKNRDNNNGIVNVFLSMNNQINILISSF